MEIGPNYYRNMYNIFYYTYNLNKMYMYVVRPYITFWWHWNWQKSNHTDFKITFFEVTTCKIIPKSINISTIILISVTWHVLYELCKYYLSNCLNTN